MNHIGIRFPRKIKRIPIISFLLLLCILCVGVFGGRRDTERWERMEREVKEKVFPAEYRDSLQKVFDVGDNTGLRTEKGRTLLFKRREKAVYEGGWGFINAGWGVIEAEFDKKKARILFSGKAFTNNFTSAFFEVRDFVRSEVDAKGLYPCFFEQHIHENRYKRSTFALFDHVKGKVYNNRKKKKLEYTIAPFSHDYISLLYYLRTREFAPGDTFSIRCFVHGKDYPILFEVHGREEVKVNAGTFNCIKVQPHLVGEGRNFNKRDKMYLWFTDDEYHVLVKGKSKVAMGWINAELIHYERK